MSSTRVPHDASQHPHQPEVAGPAPKAQWVGLFLAPAAFAVHFQLNYLLVMWVCGNDVGTFVIHFTSAVALGLSLLGGWVAYVTWRRAGAEAESDGEGVLPRTRLLGSLGMGLSAVLSLILLAQLVSGFVPPRCQ
jgi:hypothetical protein